MIHIIDDYGRTVIAIGAPGSRARVRVQYPKLIERISSLHLQNYSYGSYVADDMVTAMIDAGIESKLEAESLVEVVLEKLSPDFNGWRMQEIPGMLVSKK